jgi:hypothetical protein
MTKTQIYNLVDEEVGKRPEAYLQFLEALIGSAFATSQHVEEAWQDRDIARVWEQVGKQTDTLTERVRKKLASISVKD